MTIEAVHKIIGMPISTRELSHVDGEMFIRYDKYIDFRLDTIKVASTFRVLSDDEIAVYEYFPKTPPDSHEIFRGKPKILTRDEINKANLHSSGIIHKVDVRWRPSR